MLIDEIKNIKSSKKDLRNFGLTVGLVFIILGGLFFWLEKGSYLYLLLVGAGFILAALFVPKFLTPLQKIWMTAAIIIGWFMTRVILSLLFYLVLTPTNIFSRLFGKRFLDLKIDKSRKSYWSYREKRKLERNAYEKQY